jgi:mannosyltransferase
MRSLNTQSHQRVMILVIVLLALALRLSLLDSKSLWLDEAASLQMAHQSGMVLITEQGDPHPPAYYLFLHSWINLGQSEFILRLPSALFGALSVLVLYWIGRSLHLERLALWAAGLLAIDPLHIWYSQEARMYAPAAFLGLAGIYFAIRLLRQSSWRAWLGYIIAFAAMLYFDYGGLAVWALTIVTSTGIISWRRRWSVLKAAQWYGAQIVIVLLYAPMGPRVWNTFTSVSRSGLYFGDLIQNTLTELGLSIQSGSLTILMIVTAAGFVALGIVLAIGYARHRAATINQPKY